MQSTSALALMCCLLGVATATGRQRISPELDPKSDKKFFGPPFPADYPEDTRPKIKSAFNHPYPTVQRADTYDADYVKDENSDNGEWRAQMDYDTLRNKLHKDQKEEEAAEKEEHAVGDKLDNAVAAEKEAEKAYKDALAKEKAAEEEASRAKDDADGKVKDAEKKEAKAIEEAEKKKKDAEKAAQEAAGEADSAKTEAAAMPMQDQIDKARKHVEDEIKDLQDCTKELRDAKEKLEAVLAKQKEALNAQKAAQAANVAEKQDNAEKAHKAHSEAEVAVEKVQAEAAAEHDQAVKDADAAKAAAQETVNDSNNNLQKLKEAWSNETASREVVEQELHKAEAVEEKEASERKATEDDLHVAEERLRSFRTGGGRLEKDKSGASVPAPALSLLLAITAVVFSAMEM